jgi:catechol 2,3-dioxygenase-like lactoylglutathione lyase family enzyme
VTFTDLYHTGIVVADLDAAATEFEDLLGVRWAIPKQESLQLWTRDGVITAPFRYTYSRSEHGAPLIELIEAGPGTPWWPGEGVRARLHHLGFWADPLSATAARLEASGAQVEVAVRGRRGRPTAFTYQKLLHGPLVELVDGRLRPDVQRWLDEAEPTGQGQ